MKASRSIAIMVATSHAWLIANDLLGRRRRPVSRPVPMRSSTGRGRGGGRRGRRAGRCGCPWPERCSGSRHAQPWEHTSSRTNQRAHPIGTCATPCSPTSGPAMACPGSWPISPAPTVPGCCPGGRDHRVRALWRGIRQVPRRQRPKRGPSRSNDAEDPQQEQRQQDREYQRAKATQPTREEEEHPRWMTHRPRPTPGVSSLKGRDRSSPSWVVVSVFRARSGRVWTRVTGVGVQAERPQRSEDVRSGRRRGWRDTDRSRGTAAIAVCGCRVPSSCVPKIRGGAGGSAAGHPFAARVAA